MSRYRSEAGTGGQAGFTLIEVLVALTILSISLTVVMQIISTSLDRLRDGRDEAAATSFTQSLLDQVGTSMPLRLGESSGNFGNGFVWRVRVELYGSAADQRGWSIRPVVVTASTSWNGERRSLTLSTLRLLAQDER